MGDRNGFADVLGLSGDLGRAWGADEFHIEALIFEEALLMGDYDGKGVDGVADGQLDFFEADIGGHRICSIAA